ncbi:argininosuccinate lyase [Candidatus Gottesmanbacteria bacterium]|nr:argininosuccinate lyase [Candidatus Gottesmanbacteria bacterium]
MKKLWEKHWQLDQQVEAFETGDDLLLDQKLVWADVAGSLAHAAGLKEMGILSQKEFTQAKRGLLKILLLAKHGEFTLIMGDEDIHTKIENYLTDHYGQVGKKIHTGRSRNDQVLTAIRLFSKQQLFDIWVAAVHLADAFLCFAKQYEYVPMPGYTHMQKAMPSSVGMWASSLTASLLDDIVLLKAAYTLIDQSPLGSAAGYGVPIAIDRGKSAKLLGFGAVQSPSLYCQNSRGKIEAAVVAALVSLAQTVNKFASDVLLFTTSEFGFFTVANALATGSSIMPQKKNIDAAELLRSKVNIILGYYNSIVGISNNLPSGYNRDLQDTKKPFMEALAMSKQICSIAAFLVQNLKPNRENLVAAMTPEVFAAHQVFDLVTQGIPFRDAYKMAPPKAPLQGSTLQWITDVLHRSTHLGGPGNLGLNALQKKLAAERHCCHNATMQFTAAMARLGVYPASRSGGIAG